MINLSLRLFGSVETRIGDEPIDAFPADKVVALLAYLAVESGMAHARGSLAALLWPEHAPQKAQRNLRQALYRLRSTLDRRVPGTSDHLLTVTRRTIMLNPEHLWLDVAELMQRSHGCLDGDQDADIDRCRRLVELYRGEFMAGLTLKDSPAFDEWQMLHRERCHREALSILHALGQRYAALGRHEEVRQMAAQQLALDPWREEAHRQLMVALARSNRRSEALAQFETCRAVLARELGVEPSEETVALYRAIRDDTLAAPDLIQIAAAPRPAAKTRLYDFPEQSIEFIGRDHELGLILDHYAQQDRRLMTLVSVGGMGRRRLAVEAARRLVAETDLFPDGAYFVALERVSTAEQMAQAIADCFGMSLQDGLPILEQVIGQLDQYRALIVLDGIEDEEDSRDVLAQILGATDGARILVTSLFPLKLRLERSLIVAGLDYRYSNGNETSFAVRALDDFSNDLPDADDLPDAARMFVRVVHEFRSGWIPDANETRTVLQICRLLDGMPLALSIAASWMRVMDCRTIAKEIETNELVLHISGEDVWNRRRSIGEEFEHMWQPLPETAQRALAQISVFQDGAAMQAVYEITQADRDALAVLVDRGLLRRQGDDRGKIDLLLQQFARQKLYAMPVVARTTRRRFSAYYLDMVMEAQDLLRGLVLDEEWLRRVLAELDNIRQAWSWIAQRDGDASAADVLPWVSLCFERKGRYVEALEMIDLCLRRLQRWEHDPDPERGDGIQRLAAALHAEKSWFLWRLNRYEEAHAAAEKGLQMLPAEAPRSDHSFAFLTLGLVEDSRGRYAAARDAYAQSLRICEMDDDQVRTGRVLNFLGAATLILGDFDGAVRLHEQSLAIGRQLSDRWGISGTLHNLGLAVHALGQLKRARALFDEAIRISASIGDARAENVAKVSLADLEIDAGQYDEARRRLAESLAWSTTTGNRWGTASAQTVLGRLERTRGGAQEAEETLTQALDIWRELGDRRGTARAVYELGLAAHAQQHYTACAELLNGALELALELDANALCADILAGQARLLAETGQRKPAEQIVTFLASFGAASSRSRHEAAHIQKTRGKAARVEDGDGDPTAHGPSLGQIAKVAQEACRQPLPVRSEG